MCSALPPTSEKIKRKGYKRKIEPSPGKSRTWQRPRNVDVSCHKSRPGTGLLLNTLFGAASYTGFNFRSTAAGMSRGTFIEYCKCCPHLYLDSVSRRGLLVLDDNAVRQPSIFFPLARYADAVKAHPLALCMNATKTPSTKQQQAGEVWDDHDHDHNDAQVREKIKVRVSMATRGRGEGLGWSEGSR